MDREGRILFYFVFPFRWGTRISTLLDKYNYDNIYSDITVRRVHTTLYILIEYEDANEIYTDCPHFPNILNIVPRYSFILLC